MVNGSSLPARKLRSIEKPAAGFATKVCRIIAGFVWSREATGHVTPGAPDAACKGRVCKFLAKNAFPFKLHEGFQASILARFAGWPLVVADILASRS